MSNRYIHFVAFLKLFVGPLCIIRLISESSTPALRARALFEAVVEERLAIAQRNYQAALSEYGQTHTLATLDAVSARVESARNFLDDARRMYQAINTPVPYPQYVGD